MYSSGASASSRVRRSSSSSSYTPTSKARNSRMPTSGARNSASRNTNDPTRFSYAGSALSAAASMAPSSAAKRMSSFFKTPKKQMGFKDTRNLMDREVQASMQRKIFDFLVASNYSMVSEKLVRSPTRSDFARMFEFIFLQLDPQYTFQGKIEEEMPRIMRNLGYPVPLKPSTMQTIGAAHTMPHLLGAITWLIDAINFAEKISPQDLLLSSEDDGGQRRSLAYGYTIRCYKKLGDVPGYAADVSIFRSDSDRLLEILEENDEVVATTEELDAREDAAQEEMAEIKGRAVDSEKLEVEFAVAKDDYIKVQQYQNELQETVETVEGKQNVCSATLADLERKVAEVKMDNAAKELQISAQKMDGETARQLRAQKEELNTQLEQLKSEMARIDSDIYELRKMAYKEGMAMRERYGDFLRNFGNVQRRFDMKDDSFESAMQQYSPNEPNFTHFLQEIKEHIASVDKEVSAMIGQFAEDDAKVLEDIKKINEQNDALKEEFSKLRLNIEVKKHGQMLKREDWADELHKVKLELDVAQNELSALHAARNTKVTGHEQLAEMKKLVQNRKIAIREARNEVAHEASAKLERIFEEWDHIKECRAQLREDERALRAAIKRFTAPFD
uniref:Kinetochore protein NDC80 n=1 Tax=Ascaris suum TaxID=6253 RepID=F1KVY4_ASCSU